MDRLSRDWLKENALPQGVTCGPLEKLPERVLQFGEGNFLRGFIDWMINRLNAQGIFGGSVVVVQPIPRGLAGMIDEQQGCYTLIMRGLDQGKPREDFEVVTSISRCIDAYAQYGAYLETADNPDIRFIFSNTTESGIAYVPGDKPDDEPPSSFPGKLTAWLYRRYKAFDGAADKAVVIIPCELIEENGRTLRDIILKISDQWALGEGFKRWVSADCRFFNTLVDRIVTGYPRDEAQALCEKLGYHDTLLDACELFHFFALEGDPNVEQELPLAKAGIDAVFTPDATPYRERKVRILNGAHTMTVLGAFLADFDTVGDCLKDESVKRYLEQGIFDEIIPTLNLPKDELLGFAQLVAGRFANPFIRHELLSIALNSTSKWKTRILPSLKGYIARNGALPPTLSFSLAALIAFYRGTKIENGALLGRRAGGDYPIRDDAPALESFAAAWRTYEREACLDCLVGAVLGFAHLWGENLNAIPGLKPAVADALAAILADPAAAMRSVLY